MISFCEYASLVVQFPLITKFKWKNSRSKSESFHTPELSIEMELVFEPAVSQSLYVMGSSSEHATAGSL